jgi:hypothetical protein
MRLLIFDNSKKRLRADFERNERPEPVSRSSAKCLPRYNQGTTDEIEDETAVAVLNQEGLYCVSI